MQVLTRSGGTPALGRPKGLDQALPAGSYQLVAGEVDCSADGLQTAMDTYAPTDLTCQASGPPGAQYSSNLQRCSTFWLVHFG